MQMTMQTLSANNSALQKAVQMSSANNNSALQMLSAADKQALILQAIHNVCVLNLSQ